MKKLVKLFLVAITLCPNFALHAQTTVNISNENELKTFRTNVNSNTGSYANYGQNVTAYITADIYLNDTWTPITQFSGTLDGQFHKIDNLTGAQGLVTALNSTGIIKNLGIESGAIMGTAAQVGAFAGYSVGTIEACWNHINITSDFSEVGGITGRIDGGGKVKYCYNKGNISTLTSRSHVGGIVGRAENNDHIIENCYNRGVIGTGSGNVSGICGSSWANTNGGNYIRNCYNTGNVTCTGEYNHVIARVITGTMTNCYYLSGITGRTTGTGFTEKSSTDFQAPNMPALLIGTQGQVPYNGGMTNIWTTDNADPGNDGFPILFYQVKNQVVNCPVPTNFSTTLVTYDTAALTWNAVESGISYLLEYRAVGSNWTRHTTTETSYILSSLTPATAYDARVRTLCDDGDSSAWVNLSFTTLCAIGASAGTGGIITPSGIVGVPKNQDSPIFYFTPDENYEIASVMIDGIENTIAATDKQYRFENVVANHTIHVIFKIIGDGIEDHTIQNVTVYAYKNTVYIKNKSEIQLKSVEIMDMTGRVVYGSTQVNSPITLDLATGSYIVRLMSDNAVLNKKIVLQ